MVEKMIKRSYNFPEKLISEWEDFHRPSKDFSPSAAGAILVWMALPPEIREKARQLAHEPSMKKSLTIVNKSLMDSFSDQTVHRYLTGLTQEQYDVLLSSVKATERKLSGKK